MKECIPPSNGIVRGLLFPEFGVELPLDNGTPTIILNNISYIYIYIQSDYKPNHFNLLFPKNVYNVRIKAMHILNDPPYCDDFISLLKRVFKSKLAARLSDFNRLHFLLVLRLLYQYTFAPSTESVTSSFFNFFCFFFYIYSFARSLQSTDIYFYIDDSTFLVVKSC